MTGCPSLADLRRALLRELDDYWRTPSYFADLFGVNHGDGWLRIALVLERLVADGHAELQLPRSRIRRFRRAAA